MPRRGKGIDTPRRLDVVLGPGYMRPPKIAGMTLNEARDAFTKALNGLLTKLPLREPTDAGEARDRLEQILDEFRTRHEDGSSVEVGVARVVRARPRKHDL